MKGKFRRLGLVMAMAMVVNQATVTAYAAGIDEPEEVVECSEDAILEEVAEPEEETEAQEPAEAIAEEDAIEELPEETIETKEEILGAYPEAVIEGASYGDGDIFCYTMADVLYINGDDETEYKRTTQIVWEGLPEGKTPTFSSYDTTVATVDKTGLVTAVGVGGTALIVKYDKYVSIIPLGVEYHSTQNGIAFCDRKIEGLIPTQGTASPVEVMLKSVPESCSLEGASFTASSSDTSVATVKVSGQKVIVTPVGPGNAIITAKQNGTDFEATIPVSYTREFSEADIEALQKKLYYGEDFDVILNLLETRTLSEISLPQAVEVAASDSQPAHTLNGHFEWVEPETKIESSSSILQYPVQYICEGYEPVTMLGPLNVVEITGVKINCSNTLYQGVQNDIRFNLQYKGIQTAYLSQKIAVDVVENAKEDEKALDFRYIALGSADALIKSGNTKKSTEFEVRILDRNNPNRKPIAVAKKKVNLDNKNAIDYVVINANQTTIEWTKDNPNKTIEVSASAYTRVDGKSIAETTTPLTWTSSDTSVATVKANKDTRTAVITVKKPGSFNITATAKDKNKAQDIKYFRVLDYQPALDNSTVELDLNVRGGVEIPLRLQNGAYYENYNKSGGVTVDNKLFCIYRNFSVVSLRPTSNDIALGTYKTNLHVNVVKPGETEPTEYVYPITIKVTKNAVKVTSKATKKANIFYTDAEAKVKLSSKYRIVGASDTVAADAVGFHVESYDEATGEVTFKAKGLNKSTIDDFKKGKYNKVKIMVGFYNLQKDMELEVNVGTENVAPSVALSEIVLENSKTTDYFSEATDKKTKAKILLDDNYSFEKKNAKDQIVVTPYADGRAKVVADKKGTYNLVVTNYAQWTQPISASIKVSEVLSPQLVLERNTIVMPYSRNVADDKAYYSMKLSLKGLGNTKITDLYYNKKMRTANALYSSGALQVAFDEENQIAYFGLNKGIDFTKVNKNGSYSFVLFARDEYGNETKEVPLTIKLTEKAPSFTVSAKGSVDLIDRDGTSIVYTPNFSNVNDKVVSAKLTGKHARFFYVDEVSDGKIEVKVSKDANLTHKMNYEFGIKVYTESGLELVLAKPVKVKPTNKLPKIISSSNTITIYKNSNFQDSEYIEVSPSMECTWICGNDDYDYSKFRLTQDWVGRYDYLQGITVGVDDTLKPGRYNLKVGYYIAYASYDQCIQYVTYTVIVK